MPLVEHIYELRSRILKSLAALCVGTILGFIWYTTKIGPLPGLGDILTGPYCSLPATARADFSTGSECRLLATGPFEQFMLRVKVAATAGAVVSCPIWLYQVWAFITPGLHKNERKYGLAFTFSATLLFVSGAGLAYVVIAEALSFLLTIGDNVQTTALSGSEYFGFLINLIIIFGVSFEIPLIIVMLNALGIVSYAQLSASRRGIIMGIFVFAAIASPGQDPFSMLVLAFALMILVEAAIQVTRLNDRRRAKNKPSYAHIDDDQASELESATPLEPGSTPVATTSVSTPQPIARDEGSSFDDTL